MKRSASFLARAVALALVLSASACSWLTDFRQQPSITTWGSQTVDWSDTSTPSRGSPQRSVPTTGTAAAGFSCEL